MVAVSFLSLLGDIMKKDIKLVAIDLDSTLLDSEDKLPKENKEVLKKLKDRGIKVVLATGRPFNGYWWIRQELGLEGFDDYTICNTGAFIRRNADGKILVDNSLDKFDYEKISALLGDYDLQIALFAGTTMYNNAEEVNKEFWGDQELLKMPRLKFKDFNDIDEKVARLNFMGEEAELDAFYEENKEALEKDYMTMRNEIYSLEVLNKASGKANSLKKLCDYLDIDLVQVIYFGDGANDTKAMELAGISVAMANADDEAKETADHEADKNDRAGVGKFLKDLLD